MSLNVRLSVEEMRMTAALRRAGIEISSLVRAAIREEYRLRVEQRARGRGSQVVRQILRELPDPPELASRGFDTTDRRAVSKHIKVRLDKRRR
jgi:hypothetical protein